MNTIPKTTDNLTSFYAVFQTKCYSIWVFFFLMTTVLCFGQNQPQNQSTTINVTDSKGLKQGFWRIKQKNNSIEEGCYLDGKKDGQWKAYFPSGKEKYSITFSKGFSKGPAVFYYEDGQVMEQGIWNVNHWEGTYTFYHPNGQPAYCFNFDEAGNRQGVQQYFYENGNIKYSGAWEDGKPNGLVDVFNDQGVKISQRLYNDGEFSKNVKAKQIIEDSLATFNGTGQFTIYNMNGTLSKKGNFKSGKLIDGEVYIYGAQIELIGVERYRDGVKERQVLP